MTPIEKAKAAQAQAIADRKAFRRANTTTFEDGSTIYPDCRPGVGWVLTWPPNEKGNVTHKNYLRTRSEAVEKRRWLVHQDWAPRSAPDECLSGSI